MKLALYYYPSCPYCHRVVRAADRLGVELELRHIYKSRQHMADLVAARGRRTVPVLRIEDGDEVTWMPESQDIVRWMETRFG